MEELQQLLKNLHLSRMVEGLPEELQRTEKEGLAPLAVSDRAIVEAQPLVARLEGIWTVPEAAALVAARATTMEDQGEASRVKRALGP